jgi:seryl-tRNA synthetase
MIFEHVSQDNLKRILNLISQAKEPADDLVVVKKEIDTQVEEKKKEAKEFEIKMRQKASTIGNIVGKDAPVSLTEVSGLQLRL